MSLGLTQIGATPRSAAYALTPAVRAPGVDGSAAPSEQQFQVSAVKPVAPAPGASFARDQIRDQVMSERGVDPLSLFKLSSNDRIRAETAIRIETAMRSMQADNQARARVSATANFVDIRV